MWGPRWFWSGLDRGMKATFEWPQQLLARSLRVIQDPDVDFFDEEGFADAGFIPIIGAFDSDPTYVGSREIFDRTAGKMGVKHHWSTELAANLLTDPTFFMGGGLTKGAKAARATEQAARTWTMTKNTIGKGGEQTVGEFRKFADEALASTDLARKDRGYIKAAKKRLDEVEGLDDSMSLSDFKRGSGKRELRLSLPIMNHYGMGVRVAPGYDSWFRLASEKVAAPGAKAVSAAFGGTVGRFGLARSAFDHTLGLAGDFSSGFANRGQLDNVRIPREVDDNTAALFSHMLTPANRKFHKQIFVGGGGVQARVEKYRTLIEKGKNPVQAASKAFGTNYGAEVLRKAHSVEPDAILTSLNEHGDLYRRASEAWGPNNTQGTEIVTDAGKAFEAAKEKGALALRSFNLGRKLGLQFNKTWSSDIGMKGLSESEAAFRSASANYQRFVEAVGEQVLMPALLDWSKATGLDPDDAEKVMGHFAQMSAVGEELAEHMEMGRASGLNEDSALALAHLSERFTRSAEVMQKFAQGGTTSPYLRTLGRQLTRAFGDDLNLDDTTIRGLFSGIENEVIKEAVDWHKHLDEADTASHYIMMTGAKTVKGRPLQFLSDNALQGELGRLERAEQRLDASAEVGQELEKFAQEYGVSSAEALDIVRMGRTRITVPASKRGAGLNMVPEKPLKSRYHAPKLPEGYTFSEQAASNGTRFSVRGAGGEEVSAVVIKEGEAGLELPTGEFISTVKEHQRKGLALALLQFVERKFRKPVTETAFTGQGKALFDTLRRSQASRATRDIDPTQVAALRSRLVSVPADPAAYADRKAIAEVLHRRGLATPRSKYVRQPPATRTTRIPQPERTLKETTLHDRGVGDEGERLVGDEADIGPAMRGALGLRLVADEMKRVAKAIEDGHDLNLSTTQYGEALRMVERLSSLTEDIVFKGPEGLRMKEALRTTRAMALDDAIEIGTMRTGSPIGYLQIAQSSEAHRVLNQIFDQDELYEIVDTAMPTLGSLMRRNAGGMTIEDLSDLHRILNESGSPAGKAMSEKLSAVAESLGLKPLKAYEERPTLLLMNRLAQGRRTVTVRDFVHDMLREPSVDFQGGLVESYIIGGEQVSVASYRKFKRKPSDGDVMEIDVGQQDINRPEIEGLVIRRDDGTRFTMGAEDLKMNRAVMMLGAPKLAEADKMATANAFAMRASRGELDSALLLDGEALLRDGKRLADLEGQYMLMGSKDVLAGTMGAINSQFKHHNAMLRGYDALAFSMKRWATIFRVPFHVVNLGATISQAHSIGIGVYDTVNGGVDAMRFLNSSRKVAERYDAFSAATATAKGREGWRFMSPEFLRVMRRNPKLKEQLGLTADEMLDQGLVFKVGDSHYTMDEIMESLRPVFATATKEGLRGGSRASRAMLDLRKKALGKGKIAKAKEVRDTITEQSEIVSRLTVYFGALRGGRTPAQAAKDTLLATVDYASLTTRERDWFKRFAGFYTFARKYTPVAFDRFAREPQYASVLGHIMEQDGLLQDKDGQYVLKVTDNASLPIQRLMPQMDALRLGEAVVERFSDWGGAILGGEMAQVSREQAVEGKSNQPFTLGPAGSAIVKGVTGDPAGAVKDVRNLIWPLRIIMDPGDPFEEPTFIERFAEQVSPMKQAHTARTRAMLRGRLMGVIRDLEDKMQRTEDPEDRELLRAEAKRLSDRAKAMDTELKQ